MPKNTCSPLQQAGHTGCMQETAHPAASAVRGDFRRLCTLERATTPALGQLFTYTLHTWIESDLWPPSAWSQFGRAIHTNNDVEGWYRCLNERAKNGQLNLYLLIDLFFQEAQLVTIQARPMSERKLKRHQRVTYLRYQARLFKLWSKYLAEERTIDQLVAAHRVYAPLLFIYSCMST